MNNISNIENFTVSQLNSSIKKLIEKKFEIISVIGEISQVKKRASRLEEEIRNLRTPPMVIGHIQDITDEGAIVRSSNGTVFLVSVNPRINDSLLIPGARVALNQDNLSVIEVLSDSWDPLVVTSEIIEKPSVAFDDVGGLEEQIVQIREAVELSFTAQKYIGEGGRLVREIFDLARKRAPAIVFIDELDAIGSKRLDSATSGDREVQRTLMQLLSELDGFTPLEDVKIIASTNRPELLDNALLRPGRFDKIVEIPLPDEDGRLSILKVHTKNTPISKRIKLEEIASKTDGFSGAEINSLVVEAGVSAISKGNKMITKTDFLDSLDKLKLNSEKGRTDNSSGLYD